MRSGNFSMARPAPRPPPNAPAAGNCCKHCSPTRPAARRRARWRARASRRSPSGWGDAGTRAFCRSSSTRARSCTRACRCGARPPCWPNSKPCWRTARRVRSRKPACENWMPSRARGWSRGARRSTPRWRVLHHRRTCRANFATGCAGPSCWTRSWAGLNPGPPRRSARRRTHGSLQPMLLPRHNSHRAACWDPGMVGRELTRFCGGKAANLAEIERILGADCVPAWFAVTDAGVSFALAATVPPAAVDAAGLAEAAAPASSAAPRRTAAATSPPALGDAIAAVLGRRELTAARRANDRNLWLATPLPADLVHEITAAYAALGESSGSPPPPVAIRSSAFEEDTEQTAWAGQFDTFLFVRGEAAVLEHLQLRLGRAVDRARHPPARSAGGGSATRRRRGHRAAHGRRARGRRAADGFAAAAAARDGDQRRAGAGRRGRERRRGRRSDPRLQGGDSPGASRCASATPWATSASASSSTRAGTGTRLEETLYHQRLRAALEYVELCELVQAAARLEQRLRPAARHRVRLRGHCLCASCRRAPSASSTPRCRTPWRTIRCLHPRFETEDHMIRRDDALRYHAGDRAGKIEVKPPSRA